MAKQLSISAKQKKKARGRPRTGIRPMIGLRLSEDETERVDAWALRRGYTKNPTGEPNRSEAIRAMIAETLDRDGHRQSKER